MPVNSMDGRNALRGIAHSSRNVGEFAGYRDSSLRAIVRLPDPRPTKAIDLHRAGLIAAISTLCWLPVGIAALALLR